MVRLSDVSKRFGDVVAVAPLDLEIFRRDFLALLGPSGCGKTTLLRLIGGFLKPTTGRVAISGRDVTDWGPERRSTNMVFQGYGLFPHMNVRQNVAYGLRVARTPAREARERVDRIINLVHLDEFVERRPSELSGGQQQRVALARALVMEPEVLLLDEPLGALDLQLRKTMQEELRRIHRSIGGTFVFVTHDQSEALGLANRIAVMREGRIEQEGTAEEIYVKPATRFVAGFVGDANILRGRREAGQVRLEDGARIADPGEDGPVIVVLRPEALSLRTSAPGSGVSLSGRLSDRVYLGSHKSFKIALASGQEIVVHEGADTGPGQPEIGDTVHVAWDPESHRVLNAS